MQTEPLQIVVTPEQATYPLRELVVSLLEGDQSMADLLLAHGGLWIDGRRSEAAATCVGAGAVLVLRRPPMLHYPQIDLTPAQILYEDGDLIAIDKPMGAYVAPTPWDVEGNVLSALARFLTARDGVAPPLHLANRLDRDTTGVLLCSCNPSINAALQRTIGGSPGERCAQKEYLAVCYGVPSADQFSVTTGHGRERHGRFRVYPVEEVGRVLPGGTRVKVMQTHVQVVRRWCDAALVRVLLVTGRTHQIRLHLAHLGHPLIGDSKYGGPIVWRDRPISAHLLHAFRLDLPHPRTGALLSITSQPPAWAVFDDG